MNYLDTMIKLSTLELDCSHKQALIDVGRTLRPNDQGWQLELNRKQTELDERRELIALARQTIAQRN